MRSGEEWLTASSSLSDPLERAKLLCRGGGLRTPEQQKLADEMFADSLALALSSGSPAAFDFIDQNPSGYVNGDMWRDRYPRDRELRQKHLSALQRVWPRLDAMPVTHRMLLVRMAERCHLHQAKEPVAQKTVLACVEFGAQSFKTEHELTKLLDDAALDSPILQSRPADGSR